MIILGISPAHDASICLLDSGNVVFFSKEERISREKRAKHFFGAMERLSKEKLLSKLDLVVVAAPTKDHGYVRFVTDYFRIRFGLDPVRVHDISEMHHLQHAANAFYNSGFADAAVVVVDRNGSLVTDMHGMPLAREAETILHARYPSEFTSTYKSYWHYASAERYDEGVVRTLLAAANPTCGTIRVGSRLGMVKVYEAATTLIGLTGWLGQLENGKTMGLSAYGRPRNDLPQLFRNGLPADGVLHLVR